MALFSQKITILNFDECYQQQKELLQTFPHRWLNLTTIKQTNLFCEHDSLMKIEQILKQNDHRGITLIGSGNYHYVSLALMSDIKKPFTLILMDHHTDIEPGSVPDLLSCGSWVYHALRLIPNLKQVIIVGSHTALPRYLSKTIKHKVKIFPNFTSNQLQTLEKSILTEHIYLSIDKDIFSPDIVQTNWDQGTLQLEEAEKLITYLLHHKTCLGADICGEWKDPDGQSYRSTSRHAIRKNQVANQELIHTLLSV
ncbi:arginase family protein [Terrilactibacillus sp. BCM23-1]|uniref:Arginase family protein n=1 Tax=Terrilactibacillus tamarindi TaxID=2599694 RepID=A0A6N8CR07_9BACI|nr:arginase family protein [Terrilactibacillus tamarindi]MTT32110.1 arginase family protein [Terrilactibacillus tamarindi]